MLMYNKSIIIILLLFVLNIKQSYSYSINILVDYYNHTGGLIDLRYGCRTLNNNNYNKTYICNNINSAGNYSHAIFNSLKTAESEQLNIYIINDSNETLTIKGNNSFGVLSPYCRFNMMVTDKNLQQDTSNKIILDGINHFQYFILFMNIPNTITCSNNKVNIDGLKLMNWKIVFLFLIDYIYSENLITFSNLKFINTSDVIDILHYKYRGGSLAKVYINNCSFIDIKNVNYDHILYLPFIEVYISNSIFYNSVGTMIVTQSNYIKLDNVEVYSNIYYEYNGFLLLKGNDDFIVELNNFYFHHNSFDSNIFGFKIDLDSNLYLNGTNITIINNSFQSNVIENYIFGIFRKEESDTMAYSCYFNNITVLNNKYKKKDTPSLFIKASQYCNIDINNIQIDLPNLIKINNSNLYIHNSIVNVTESITLDSYGLNITTSNSSLSKEVKISAPYCNIYNGKTNCSLNGQSKSNSKLNKVIIGVLISAGIILLISLLLYIIQSIRLKHTNKRVKEDNKQSDHSTDDESSSASSIQIPYNRPNGNQIQNFMDD